MKHGPVIHAINYEYNIPEEICSAPNVMVKVSLECYPERQAHAVTSLTFKPHDLIKIKSNVELMRAVLSNAAYRAQDYGGEPKDEMTYHEENY